MKNGLSLREIVESDIESIRVWRNQEQIQKYFINVDDISEEQQRQWFKNYLLKTDDIMFMIEENINFKSAIGTVALYNINKATGSAEFGRLMIGNMSAQGKGLGKQAIILACTYAFKVLNLSEVYLYVLCNNIKAIRIYLKLGFIVKDVISNTIYMSLDKRVFFGLISI
ncbi:GNAT family N-acetyltransferase [Bacillus sp. SN10]|uniref:GNAT family N-acetyltransferase n=1 Tax=Bacillus sp. SN10 TaxID=2056493 RepID=UPI0012FED0F4|nr:GNAT family N-acetyltransferase [Bacillus sp. SN10]